MNERQLAALVAELDALVPRDGAVLRCEYGDPGEPWYTGNRLGYLRLGIALLKVADAPPDPERPWRVRADLSDLGDPDVEPGDLAIFVRRGERDGSPLEPPPPAWTAIPVLLVLAGLGVALVIGIVLWLAR